MVDIVTQNLPGRDSNYWFAGIQAEYHTGMWLDYDVATDTLKVWGYNLGPIFEDFRVGIGGLTNQAVFISINVQTDELRKQPKTL